MTRKAFALAVLFFAACAAPGDSSSALQVEGLLKPVEIIRDPWGVSHIYAENQPDLFFAQGYNAARDRLFQLEIWRRMATGTMAEAFGERYLPQDVGARLLRLRVDMREELAHYHPDGEEIVHAFVRGVNAYVDQANADPESLPVEFRLLGLRPGRWTPEVVVSRHNGLFRNAHAEVELAGAVAKLGAERVKRLRYFEPPDPDLAPAEGLDLTLVGEQVLQLYRASRSRPDFQPEDLADPTLGSNNWVVSGERSETGMPFMANDPHRSLQAPSLRYFVHLNAPGWNVIGGGEPALPGVSIGHNDHGAWGLTIFAVDQEDLYVYDTHPEDPLKYRYKDGWEKMTVVEESIPVKGQPDYRATLKFTRHGPVLDEDPDNRKAYALRAAWLEVGTSPYLASLRMNQAKSWQEFRQACAYFLMPSENMLWADREGNIGWQATGITPLRPNWNGLLPVPGDGRYEWDGFLPALQLPHAANPPRGYLATANQHNLPEGYQPIVGWSWSEPYRYQRLQEVLGAEGKFDLQDMRKLQLDELSIPARTLVPMLLEIEAGEAARPALDLLRGWDYVMSADSPAAAVYILWERRLREGLARRLYPRGFGRADPPKIIQVIQRLREPGEEFGDEPDAGRDAFMMSCLKEALESLDERFGDDPGDWRYGSENLHYVYISHPLSGALGDAEAARLNHGPLPRGGNRHSVNQTNSRDNQRSGATFRVIADLSDWDKSIATNSPGQSGDPSSPHYADLFEPWARGEYFPLLYSREKVEARAESTLRLIPAQP